MDGIMIKKVLPVILGVFLLADSLSIEAKDSTQVDYPTIQVGGMVVLKQGATGNNFYANSELNQPNTINTGLSSTASCPPGTTKHLHLSPYTVGGFMNPSSYTGIFIVCNLQSDNNIFCNDARARGVDKNTNTAIAVNWMIYCQ